MPKNVIQYDLLISCPGDVQKEKEIIWKAVSRFNELYSDVLNISIRPRDWKHSSFPQSGDSPQQLLNEQFVNDCDAAVAIFWSRFGTPTDEYDSGTEEEIEIMLAKKRQVFLYFSDSPISPSLLENDQHNKILEFKKKYTDKGIYYSYNTVEEFEEMFFAHLSQYFLSKKSVDEIKEANKPKFKVVGIDIEDKLNDEAYICSLSSKQIKKKQEYLSTIVTLYDDIKKIILPVRKAIKDENPFEIIINYKPVTIEDKDKELLLEVAKHLSITLDESFFQLGSLSIDPLSVSIFVNHELIGTEQEKNKYNKIQELIEEIHNCFKWMPIEEAFYNYKGLRLALQNYGTAYDEDVEITLFFPKDSVKTLDQFPQFSNEQIRYLLKEIELVDLFGIPGTSQYYDYDESNRRVHYRPVGINNYFGIEPDYSDDYYNELNNVLDYEVFNGADCCIVRLKMEYIKHNTAIAFPSIIILNSAINRVKYQISSKNTSEITNGILEIVEEH